jgi:hypothetical protein
MFHSIESTFRDLQRYARFIDQDLDRRNRKAFVLHVRQREEALYRLRRLFEAAVIDRSSDGSAEWARDLF